MKGNAMKTPTTDRWKYRRNRKLPNHQNNEVGWYALAAAIVFDDGGAGAESIIAYRISCPHHAGAGKYACDNAPWPIDTLKVCGPCIQEWLMQEAKE